VGVAYREDVYRACRAYAEALAALRFTREELEGVPEGFLEEVSNAEGTYDVLANVTPHALMGENAKRDATLLGYRSWADYQTEPRMARTAERALAFLEGLRCGLEAKFRAELERLSALKAADTGDPTIRSWDWRYYENQLRKREHDVDAEALRVFFPLQPCLRGMLEVYETIFGLRFHEIENPDPWFPDVSLHVVTDAGSGAPLGLFYLDLFPREGKYNHFAQFEIVSGRLRPDGRYQRPVVALVLADLRLHAPPDRPRPKDPQAIVNSTLAEVFIAPPEGSHFAAYWGHLTGYDAGYYGYAWSEAIAEDLATEFQKARDGLMSVEVGMRLRQEICAPGGSREAEDLVRSFLGRERSNEPFLRSLGIGAP
jgi:Zn-dependent oligopeptidase